MLGGVDFVSVIVGLFAISEVMMNVEQRITAISEMDIGNWLPTWADIKGARGRCSVVRGSVSFWVSSPDVPRRRDVCGL